MSEDQRQKVIDRLRRIEGQVRGIIGMVAQERYCMDVLVQTSAAVAALRGVEDLVMETHLKTCVAEAMRSHDDKAQKEKVKEVMQAIGRIRRQG